MRGDRLRDLRNGRGESQKQLADLLGVTENSIANWENGRREPEALALLRMADHYVVDAGYLMGLTDDPARQKDLPPGWEEVVTRALEAELEPGDILNIIGIIEARTAKKRST